MANKVANETTDTTMENATNFNSETNKSYLITILKDVYEIYLKTW